MIIYNDQRDYPEDDFCDMIEEEAEETEIAYIRCPDIISFSAVKNDLTRKGYIYIQNPKLSVSRHTNYVKIDNEICQFALCSKSEYELNN